MLRGIYNFAGDYKELLRFYSKIFLKLRNLRHLKKSFTHDKYVRICPSNNSVIQLATLRFITLTWKRTVLQTRQTPLSIKL
jgi:hypothetical protein